MVMSDINDYMTSLADKYSNLIGHASDVPDLNSFGDEDYDDWDVEEDSMVIAINDAATEVTENLAFMGNGTTSRDVMIAILGLEAQIALLKQYLLLQE